MGRDFAHDNRQFINGVFWILRTGAPWRDFPPDYGDWKNTHRRLCWWRDKGIWERLLEQVVIEPDFEWLMIDASHIKVYPAWGWSPGWESSHEPHKRGLNTKIHLAVDAHGMPVRILITEGTTTDCTQAGPFIDRIKADWLLADKAHDSDAILEMAESQDIQVVIPGPTHEF